MILLHLLTDNNDATDNNGATVNGFSEQRTSAGVAPIVLPVLQTPAV